MAIPFALIRALAVMLTTWFFGFPMYYAAIINISIFLALHLDDLAVIRKTFSRDMKGLWTLIRIETKLKKLLKKGSTVDDLFTEVCQKHPDKVALVSVESGKQLTFQEVRNLSNQMANYFLSVGLKEGDQVALLMNNSIEYICFWLGMAKIGVISALINNNLRMEPLGHSVEIADAKAIVCDVELQTAIDDAVAAGHIKSTIPIFVYGQLSNGNQLSTVKNFLPEMTKASKLSPPVTLHTNFKSTLFYIYTSGTTGLPKAAFISHARYYMMAKGVHTGFDMTPNDVLYVTMPLYHSAAGILGSGQMVLSGCTVVIRKKFSASQFWDECDKYNCTVSQYIGEICRYLLTQPAKKSDKNHSVRLMFGNGLRPQIWQEFVDRFNIRKVGEFYGSTEGNNSILNLDNKVGACGFIPVYPFLKHLYPVSLIKVDEKTSAPIRDENGLCIRCKPGESGEMVGKIIKGNPIKDFQGYVSKRDTTKKTIPDCFTKGDVGYSSGDLLYWDELGYMYFKDRTGDTFRWKGENVSTSEVEAVVSKVVGMSDAVTYGVAIPNTEGKAGMTAIVDENENCNLVEVNKKLKGSLPPYARPVFLRLLKKVDTTGTYKLKKSELQAEGYDLAAVRGDPIFYADSKTGEYAALTPERYEDLLKGNLKF